MAQKKYYKVESNFGDGFVRTCPSGCVIVKMGVDGNVSINSYSVPFKREEGAVVTDSNYNDFIYAFKKVIKQLEKQ